MKDMKPTSNDASSMSLRAAHGAVETCRTPRNELLQIDHALANVSRSTGVTRRPPALLQRPALELRNKFVPAALGSARKSVQLLKEHGRDWTIAMNKKNMTDNLPINQF
jgi:hypothetical protein